jgi:hypothetical protein
MDLSFVKGRHHALYGGGMRRQWRHRTSDEPCNHEVQSGSPSAAVRW